VRALSFVDNITQLAVGDDAAEQIFFKKMEQCTKLRKRWAEDNVIEFELAKTSDSVFIKKRVSEWNVKRRDSSRR
jgi:hypothetical protein